MNLLSKLQTYGVIISIIGVVFSASLSLSLYYIKQCQDKKRLQLDESWRDAVSRSWEDGEAYPFRAADKWAVNFRREACLTIHFQSSVHVKVIRNPMSTLRVVVIMHQLAIER